VLAGDARGYVPLRNLAQPAPRSAREVLNLGERRRFVVTAIDPPRRGIDLALPGIVDVPADSIAPVEEQVVEALGMTDALAPAEAPAAEKAKAVANRASAKRTATRKTAAKKAPASKRTAKKAVAKATVAKKTSTKAPTGKAARSSAATKKSPAGKSSPKKATAKAGTAKRAPRR
jgi:hypothetical protein